MSRNLAELKSECVIRGLQVVRTGNRENKADYENALARAIWAQQFPGVDFPPQMEPMLAFDYKNLIPGKMNKNDPNPEQMMQDNSGWFAQEKKQGARLLLHIGRPSHEFNTRHWIHSRRISDETYRLNDNSGNFRHVTDFEFPEEWNGAVFDGEALSSRVDIDTGDTLTRDIEKATIALTNMDSVRSMEVQKAQGFMNLFLFDCLFTKGGQDIRSWPYHKRLIEANKFCLWCKSAGLDQVQILPVCTDHKEEYYERIVKAGGEGIMLKKADASYEHKRTRAMYKRKKFIEIDGWVSGFIASDPESGWSSLIGALEFSAYTETGSIHTFAACANVTLEDRKLMTIQVDGRPALNPDYLGRIATIRGMEWSSRNYRLSNARIQRWREGMDGKPQADCLVDMAAIRAEVESRRDF